MDEKRTTARAFHDAEGVEAWRVLFSGAHAYYRVASFSEGADSSPRSQRSPTPWATSPTWTCVPKA